MANVRGSAVRTVVLVVAFNETPAIDVNDLALCTVFTSKQVETADSLLESFADLRGPRFFLVTQSGDKSLEDYRQD